MGITNIKYSATDKHKLKSVKFEIRISKHETISNDQNLNDRNGKNACLFWILII